MYPLTYWEQIIRMKDKSGKFDLRLRIVHHAIRYGIKPSARRFTTTVRTVRKWLRRYRQEKLAGLVDLPKIPHNCPHKTSSAIARKIIELRKRYPFMGAANLKNEFHLSVSHTAINRILRDHGLVVKRRKKHKRKNDLGKVKRHWKLFGQISVDTKDLKDIPHYWPQMKTLNLPKYQFTAREVRSGLMFLGFANEKSASNACLFARMLCEHLRNCSVNMKQLKFQTDNGSEFIGCFRQDRTRDGFGATVARFDAIHKRIPPRAWSYNSDVETVHSTIEREFYDWENFENAKDFHHRVASYQACYNLARQNTHKDNKTPLQIITEVNDKIDPAVARLPPLMLDLLGPDYITKDELTQRGYDLPCYPYICEINVSS